MSVKQSRKGVFTFTTWKLTRLISVLTITNLIEVVKPILNWTFIALIYKVLMSILFVIVFL
jgi:cytochrome c oxidase subunit IV